MSDIDISTTLDFPVTLRLDQIDIGYRLRPVDALKVGALKASIEQLGLRTPISVTGERGRWADPEARFTLRAGAHRLEAMRALGADYIPALIRNDEDLDAELWEIDENLIRAELTPADRALFVFRRKEIYLLKYPETAQGVAGAKARHAADASDNLSFAESTAQATGQSKKTVERDASRGEKISDKALRMLRGTRHDKGIILDRLKTLRADQQEVFVQALFNEDKAKSAEAKEIRTDKMATKRAIKTDLINAIAAHGTVTAGEMPRAAFPIGYADPPWQQEAWSDETGQDKGLMYPPMPLDEIIALCAGERSPFTPDALVALWAPTNRIDDAITVLRGWGFDFKSMITWDKVDMGMGRWVRDQTEHLLIGTRGDFPGLKEGSQPRSLYAEKKSEHSRKPVWFAELLDRLFPTMKKLELFQRKASLADGDVRLNGKWDFWGFEASDVSAPSVEDVVVEPTAPEPKSRSKKTVKPPKLSAYDLQKEASAARKNAYRETITTTPDEGLDTLVLVARGKLADYDAAVRKGDEVAFATAADHLDAICEHLFGLEPGYEWGADSGPPHGNGKFSCLYDARKWLADRTAAPDGSVPIFGQKGRLLIEVGGCRIDLHCGGLFGFGIAAHVVDLDKPFISETGFRSLGIRLFGASMETFLDPKFDMRSYLEGVVIADLTEGGKKKLKLHKPPFGSPMGRNEPCDDAFIRERRSTDPAWQPGGYLHVLTSGDENEVAA